MLMRTPEEQAWLDVYRQALSVFLNLPTNFALTPEQVQATIDVAQELLDRSPELRRLLRTLGL